LPRARQKPGLPESQLKPGKTIRLKVHRRSKARSGIQAVDAPALTSDDRSRRPVVAFDDYDRNGSQTFQHCTAIQSPVDPVAEAQSCLRKMHSIVACVTPSSAAELEYDSIEYRGHRTIEAGLDTLLLHAPLPDSMRER